MSITQEPIIEPSLAQDFQVRSCNHEISFFHDRMELFLSVSCITFFYDNLVKSGVPLQRKGALQYREIVIGVKRNRRDNCRYYVEQRGEAVSEH